MAATHSKRVLLGRTCVVITGVFLAAGYFEGNQNEPRAFAAAPTAAPAAPARPVATAPAKMPPPTVFAWDKLENGCTTEQVGTQLHVTGKSNQDGWNHWNGVQTSDEYPEGDFTAAVDFKVPRFAGTPGAIPLVYLRVASANKEAVGIFLRPDGDGYRVQAWTTPQTNSQWLKRLGDEATAFHRMTLRYEAATQVATGWIDDALIGAVKSPLTGKLRFMLVTNTDKAGMDIDIVYDHFSVTPGVASGPTPAASPNLP